MKTKILLVLLPLVALGAIISLVDSNDRYSETARLLEPIDGCVFMTVMGEQSATNFRVYKSDENLSLSVGDGLKWLAEAQLPNGGYGAGSHNAQHERNPHAVQADPATTAMVAQAFLRSGTTLKSGPYSGHLKRAIHYLLETVEQSKGTSPYITEVRGTQIQSKLGENIDAVLTAHLLSNLLDRKLAGVDNKRVARALDICVSKIEAATDASGRQTGAGWAGVLQSGLATSALESAQAVGASVNEEVVIRSNDYQKSNYDEETGNVKTDDGAGVMLYAVSGSVRGSARDARKAAAAIEKAKQEGHECGVDVMIAREGEVLCL